MTSLATLPSRGTAAALAALAALIACGTTAESRLDAAGVNPPIIVGTDTIPAERVRTYLVEALGFTSRGGQAFCSYVILGRAADRVFVSTACEELLQVADSLESGSGSGGPAALVLDTTASPVRIVDHEVPGDGNRHARDVRRIFPDPVQRQILGGPEEHNRRATALRAANRDAARAHFREPVVAAPPPPAELEARHTPDLGPNGGAMSGASTAGDG